MPARKIVFHLRRRGSEGARSDLDSQVGDRLHHSDQPFNCKNQMFLPLSQPFASTLSSFFYRKNVHAVAQSLLNINRQRLWIVHGKKTFLKILGKCLICFHVRSLLASHIMRDLLRDKKKPTRLFTIAGVGYCGPMYLIHRIRGRIPD